MKVKLTAGRDSLGEFAPKFAELNDDILFGEVCQPKIRRQTTVRFILGWHPVGMSAFWHKIISFLIRR